MTTKGIQLFFIDRESENCKIKGDFIELVFSFDNDKKYACIKDEFYYFTHSINYNSKTMIFKKSKMEYKFKTRNQKPNYQKPTNQPTKAVDQPTKKNTTKKNQNKIKE